jgi:hypothetical protein
VRILEERMAVNVIFWFQKMVFFVKVQGTLNSS